MTTPLPAATVSAHAAAILDEVETAVVGKRAPLSLVLSSILAGGHVLLEDFPGLGKTLAARSFAQTLGLGLHPGRSSRPTCCPPTSPAFFVYDQRSHGVRRSAAGPLFTGLLLADEINRTPPKTQAALLEAMQERQVTVEGTTFPLPPPFHVLATANPVEYEGTYPLPEAQLDRFLMRVSFGYPTADEEYDVLRRRLDGSRKFGAASTASWTPSILLQMQRHDRDLRVDPSISRYCVRSRRRDTRPSPGARRRLPARVRWRSC